MKIKVGLSKKKQVKIYFSGEFQCSEPRINIANQALEFIYDNENSRLVFQMNGKLFSFSEGIRFFPLVPENSFFSVYAMDYGIDFHWNSQDDFSYSGDLIIKIVGEELLLINELSLENYLNSVIASEMNPDSPIEFLKAHSIISRSWVLANRKRNHTDNDKHEIIEDDTIIRWYDNSGHRDFDVCADDHCQRYQGIIRSSDMREVVYSTAGIVLKYQDEICDARFSKCCGGVTEDFQNVWENTPKPYLISVHDSLKQDPKIDLSSEQNFQQWLGTEPEVLCNIQGKSVLSSILKEYDFQTKDFFHWGISYTGIELANIINEKTGIGIGELKEIIPLKRGKSGRLYLIEIVGDKKSFKIGKELEIRRVLSKKHLYSSAFTVNKKADRFEFRGLGWGHGVGLCQIGAANLAAQGADYTQILRHYYPGARIEKLI